MRNILKKQTEQEGFEPPEPLGSMVFKTTEANPQGMSNKELTETAETRLQASLQEHPEIEPNSAPDRPTAQAEMISTLADLLAAGDTDHDELRERATQLAEGLRRLT